MAKDFSKLTPAEQVAAGFAIGVAAILSVRFGAKHVVSLVTSKGPKLAAKKLAEQIIADVGIGRVPILQIGERVTVWTVGLSAFTTAFWLMGGTSAVIEFGKGILGDRGPGKPVPDFFFDEPAAFGPQLINMNSPGGAIQAIRLNPAAIDP